MRGNCEDEGSDQWSLYFSISLFSNSLWAISDSSEIWNCRIFAVPNDALMAAADDAYNIFFFTDAPSGHLKKTPYSLF